MDNPTSAKPHLTKSNSCPTKRSHLSFQDFLTRRLIDKGYVTSRVLIPEQNLASGRLAVQIVAGRVGKVRDQGPRLGIVTVVMPAVEGDLLNQRDLDQTLENIRRLATQYNVEFDLVPGAKPGETDIVVKHPEGRKWRGLLTLDDSGADSTGKYQFGGVITFDSLAHLYDALTLTLNRNANFSNDTLGTSSSSINWSVPFGYWSILVGVNQSKYKQTVAGFSGDMYAQIDDDAEMVLGFMTPLFEQIDAGEIVPPYAHEYRWHFASTESPLFKYDDLCEAAAEYGHALEDWTSTPSR